MKSQGPRHQPLSHRGLPIRWSYLVERVLGRWDWTARLAVLALVVTTCATAMLGVLFGVASDALGALLTGVVALAGWSARRSVAPAAVRGV